jgi:hypothetical protein
MTPRSLGTKPEKMKNSEDPVRKVLNLGTRSFIQSEEKLTTRAHMQKGEGSRRLRNRHQAKQAVGWAEVGRGRPAQVGQPSPFQGPVDPPFDLAAIRTIYIPEARSHASTHSSSVAEEQRREGHHLGEERVELVD